jgi:hypothetical protein
MRRGRVAYAAGMLAAGCLMAGVWVRGQGTSGKYHAAGLAMAGDIAYPMNSQAPGFVTLDVRLSASGSAQNVTVVRDVAPLTAAAQGALTSWQFTPATFDGQAVAGVMRVNVAFNPYNPSGVGLPGESLQAASAGSKRRFSAGAGAEGELCDVSADYGSVGDDRDAGACGERWEDSSGECGEREDRWAGGSRDEGGEGVEFLASDVQGPGGGVGCGGGLCVCGTAGGDEMRGCQF